VAARRDADSFAAAKAVLTSVSGQNHERAREALRSWLGRRAAAPTLASSRTAMPDEQSPSISSEPERRADRNHRGAVGLNGVDDLGVVDALE
jgi:hypothetical protein